MEPALPCPVFALLILSAARRTLAITPLAATAFASTVIAPAGMVAGVSGPGIMSGLAGCGALAGGGAVAGLVVLGSVPALASVAIMHHALRRDDDLPGPERAARTAGRIGAIGGAVAGSTAGVTAVSALGVPGLGAAGISSGLAAIGAHQNPRTNDGQMIKARPPHPATGPSTCHNTCSPDRI